MVDEIVIAEALNHEIRIHAAVSTAMVETARKAHDSAATCTAALGRTLTVTALLASDLKRPEEHVRVRINGGGPIGTILTEGDGAGNVRGTADHMNLYASRADGHLDVGKVVGNQGTLQVAIDMGLKEPFTGTVLLRSGEIGEDFAAYFLESQQTGSVVSVGVLVDTDSSVRAAGGMIIQLLPGASEETIDIVEAVSQQMRPMSETVNQGITPEELIMSLFPDAEILAHKPLQWHCDCSKEHFSDALASLRESDLEDMIQEDHGAEIICHYCRSRYTFTEEELMRILENKRRAENRKH